MSTAIVRRAAYPLVSRYYPFLKTFAKARGRLYAAKAAGFVARNVGLSMLRKRRFPFRRAPLSRSTKRRRIINRRKVGERINSSNAKRRLLEGTETIGTKSLSGTDPQFTIPTSPGIRLLTLPKTADNDESVLNTRQRNIVNFRGVKICLHLDINTNATWNGERMYFNCAIVSPKAESNLLTSIDTAQFFRGQDGARFTSFIPTTLSGLDCRCLAINTDKYIVHRHKRIIMGPWESTEGKGEKTLEFYMPVKRQIRYESSGDGEDLWVPEGKDMWLVYWCSFGTETAASAGVASILNVRHRIVQFFREPKV